MDLGGVRRKMTRKNCEHINAVKTVNSYGLMLVRRRTTFKKNGTELYIDAYCMYVCMNACMHVCMCVCIVCACVRTVGTKKSFHSVWVLQEQNSTV